MTSDRFTNLTGGSAALKPETWAVSAAARVTSVSN